MSKAVLIAGIPFRELLGAVRERYGADVRVFAAETRPFEQAVADAIQTSLIPVTLITDNMIAALLETETIDAVWSLYTSMDGDAFTGINGAHMAAVLAAGRQIPFIVYPWQEEPAGDPAQFHGSSIAVKGAAAAGPAFDCIPAELITEVFADDS